MPISLVNQKLQKQATLKGTESKDLVNQEFISSFDVNERFSDTYQNSILAIS